MAGIGFELRKIMRDNSFSGLVGGYFYAGILNSGPWVISIVGIWLIGALNPEFLKKSPAISQFQISVTYLMVFSLILAGPFQLMLTRFFADRLYEKREGVIIPNMVGALVVTVVVSGSLGLCLLPLFQGASFFYRLLMHQGFIVLCCIWVAIVLLSSLKAYRMIVLAFLVGYGVAVGLAIELRDAGVEGLLGGFVAGQLLMLLMLLVVSFRSFPAERFIALDFLDRRQVFVSLAWTGLFHGLGLWIDKFLFWFNPFTSEEVLAPLRASPLYDLPIFLAYLTIIPAMASFLIRMETDFSEKYHAFFQAVNGGACLDKIYQAKDDMVRALSRGIFEIVKIQGLTVAILLMYARELLERFGISPLYRFLFSVDVLAVAVQVLFLAVLNILFYLDKRRDVLRLTCLLVLLNGLFTALSQWGGPRYYGFGFGMAITAVTLVGFILLYRRLDRLEYETFMLQPFGH